MKSTKKRTLFPLAILSLVLLFGVSGCSKGTVTGKVTYGGETVPVGTVTFIPVQEGKGQPIVISITDGQYTAERVPAGSYTVTVSTISQRQTYNNLKKGGSSGPLNPSGGGGKGGQAPGIDKLTKDKPKDKFEMPGAADIQKGKDDMLKQLEGMIDVPAKFADPEKSGLKIEVKSGKNNFDIDLPKD